MRPAVLLIAALLAGCDDVRTARVRLTLLDGQMFAGPGVGYARDGVERLEADLRSAAGETATLLLEATTAATVTLTFGGTSAPLVSSVALEQGPNRWQATADALWLEARFLSNEEVEGRTESRATDGGCGGSRRQPTYDPYWNDAYWDDPYWNDPYWNGRRPPQDPYWDDRPQSGGASDPGCGGDAFEGSDDEEWDDDDHGNSESGCTGDGYDDDDDWSDSGARALRNFGPLAVVVLVNRRLRRLSLVSR